MRIKLTTGGETMTETTLDDFLAVNDHIGDDELAEINATLARGETYRGDGGTRPNFTIEPVD
jgi:hypothetical protein